MIIALTDTEAKTMRDSSDALFGRFGDAAAARRDVFDELRRSLKAAGLDWPTKFYGERGEWRPFGPATPTIEQFVSDRGRPVRAGA